MKKANYILPFYLLIIIILVNMIFYNTNIRVDLTQQKIFSLSKGTINILKKIDENMFIDVYYSKELPSQINSNKEYLLSILKDYVSYSGGKIKLRENIIDSDKKNKDAMEEGIMPVRFDIISKEKFEQREGFLGLVIRYLDKKETITFVPDVSNIEYDLSSKISTMIKEKKQTIYFITNSKAISSYQILPEIKERISNNYEIRETTLDDLYNKKDTVACFIGPNMPLEEKELFYLDQFLVQGNRLFLAYDKKYVSMDSFFSRDNNTSIDKILEKNGIKIKNTLILDRNSQAIQIAVRQGFFIISNIVKYPYFIVTNSFNTQNPTLKDIYSLTIPFASPIEYSTTNLKATYLIKTSKYSWANKENVYVNINPFQEFYTKDDDLKGPFDIAVLFEGSFVSSFEKPIEIKEDKKSKKLEPIQSTPNKSMLYLISSSKFIHQENLNPENIQYFINILNYIASDNDLLMIRNKKAGFIPLRDIDDKYKVLIKYFNIIFPVIIVIGFGIYRFRKIQINRKNAKKIYGGSYE